MLDPQCWILGPGSQVQWCAGVDEGREKGINSGLLRGGGLEGSRKGSLPDLYHVKVLRVGVGGVLERMGTSLWSVALHVCFLALLTAPVCRTSGYMQAIQNRQREQAVQHC